MKIEFPVTRTKILIPRRRTELVTRKRLMDTLYELLDNKLVLIAAPAGYGKTSLLIDFISQSDLPFCWYSLDALDKEPQRFIAHFISSINQRFPKFGQSSALALNNSTQDRLNVDSLVTTIINDAYENIREHFVIVLDDYHLVRESKMVDHFISRFIQDVDENCHLVIASRTLLTLPDLPLMVARSQVGGLSFEELAFRADEIQRFMAQNYHQTINEQSAQELALQTEGWITGLLMSTQMMGQEASSRLRVARVSGVGLYEYLAQQVLEQQPAALQEFLLRSSLLEEFTAEFCQEVIGAALHLPDTDWDDLIDHLFRNNLFVLPVGEEQVWLRYHHLFRDFLRERMQRQRPEETRSIQLRLADVYAAREQWEQAFIIYQQLGQTEAIADLAEKYGSTMVVRGQLVTLMDWLNALPAGVRSTRPALLSLMATVATMRGDTRQGIQLFNQAIAMAEKVNDPVLLGRTLVRRSGAAMMLGEHQAALQDAERAMQLDKSDPEMYVIDAEAVRCKGMALHYQGRLIESLTWLGRSLEVYHALKDEPNIAKVSLELGRVHEALGSYLASEKAYLQALEIWQSAGNTIWQANLLNNLGVLQHLLGDYETAASTLEKAVQLSREGGYPRMEAFSLTSIGDLYRDLDATSEALDAYRWARMIARQIMDSFLIMYLDLSEANLARAQNQFFRANELLSSATQHAETSQSIYEKYLCNLESGCLNLKRKEWVQAVTDLEGAAKFFRNEGFRVEAIRAHLYLMVAYYFSGQAALAVSISKEMLGLITGPESRHPLVIAGRDVQTYLETLATHLEIGGMTTELNEQIKQWEERIPQIRRNLRRRAMAVPFAPPKIIIRALGRMQVKINDRQVSNADWQTQSCRDLFFLILAHSEGLSKEDIGAIFWPESSSAEIKLRFKNNIYRVRHAVGKEAITLKDDYYYFNRSLDYEYDVESFLREITQAEQSSTTAQKLEHYQTGLKVYKGSFLPEIEETWVIAERERLRQLYLDTLLKVAEIYLSEKAFENALNYCQRALKEDNCMEDAHRLAMRVYAATGSRAALVRQYEDCCKALLEEIDAAPSPQTQNLFELLMK